MATLLAYEWTPNEYRYDFGHKNIYYKGFEGEIYRSGDEGGMTRIDCLKVLNNTRQWHSRIILPQAGNL